MSSSKPETRTLILDAAWALLIEEPPVDVRMSDIAKAAGVSRQAVYLHFPSRLELLVATTRHLDDVKDVDTRLAASRTASSGQQRLESFIEAWGGYIPEIYGVARALRAMMETDEDARAAWNDRMEAVRQGCRAAVNALLEDGVLNESLSAEQAADILWTQLSIANWEQLTRTCGWSQQAYIEMTKSLCRRVLLK